MSTAREIVEGIEELVTRMSALIGADAVEHVGKVAADLNCAGTFTQAVEFAERPFGELRGWSESTLRPLFGQLDGLAALLGTFGGPFGVLSENANRCNGWMQGLGSEVQAETPMNAALTRVNSGLGKVAEAGTALFSRGEALLDGYPSEREVDRLVKSLDDLRAQMRCLRQKIDDYARKKEQPAQ